MVGLIFDSLYGQELQKQAYAEGLVQDAGREPVGSPNPVMVEKALQSLLLYGPGLLFAGDDNLFVDPNSFKKLGICKLRDNDRFRIPFYKGDNPSEDEVMHAILEARFYSPFIYPYMYPVIKSYLASDTLLDKVFEISFEKLGYRKTRRIVYELPELAMLSAAGMWDDHYLEKYSEEAIQIVDMSFMDESLVPVFLHLIDQPKKLLAESNDLRLPVLTASISPPAKSVLRPKEDADATLQVLKFALAESGFQMPRIKTISEVLERLDDPRVLSFQSLVKEISSEVQGGNLSSLAGLQKKLESSKDEMKTISKLRKRLRWAFLIPVASGIAEAAVGLLPAASIAISLGLGGVDANLYKREAKHRWMWLFASKQ